MHRSIHPGPEPARVDPARARRVTLGLVATGALCGGLIGTALLTALLGTGPHGRSPYDLRIGLLFGGTFGALVGAVGAPVLGWGLLRHVPLGRAIGLTALGTVAGALGGYALGWYATASGVLGFVAGGVLARLVTPRPGPGGERG